MLSTPSLLSHNAGLDIYAMTTTSCAAALRSLVSQVLFLPTSQEEEDPPDVTVEGLLELTHVSFSFSFLIGPCLHHRSPLCNSRIPVCHTLLSVVHTATNQIKIQCELRGACLRTATVTFTYPHTKFLTKFLSS